MLKVPIRLSYITAAHPRQTQQLSPLIVIENWTNRKTGSQCFVRGRRLTCRPTCRRLIVCRLFVCWS